LNSQNAGGNSEWSEAISFEIMKTLFGAELICTEMEINYWPMGGKITDYSVRMYDELIGVSVTRALKFKGVFREEDAFALLTKKLYGINESTRLVIEANKWSKQMLHIWAENKNVAEVLMKVWNKMDNKLTANTFVLITVTDKNSEFIFRNPCVKTDKDEI